MTAATIVLGSSGALLTMIQVAFLLFYDEIFQVHI